MEVDNKRLDKKLAKKRQANKRNPYTTKGVRAKENNLQIHILRNRVKASK